VKEHLSGADDSLVTVAPLLNRLPRFAGLTELTWAKKLAFNPLETKAAVDVHYDLSAVVTIQLSAKSKMCLIAGSQEFIEMIKATNDLHLKHKKRGSKRKGVV
jgi:hypothetical protein